MSSIVGKCESCGNPIYFGHPYALCTCGAKLPDTIVEALGMKNARRQLLLPVSDNYFCRRRVGKGSAAGDHSGTQ